MSQCEAAESSSQVEPQVMDGKDRSPLDEVLRQGVLQMLVQAVGAELTAYIETHQHEVGQDGRRLVACNGHARQRTIVKLFVDLVRGQRPKRTGWVIGSLYGLEFSMANEARAYRTYDCNPVLQQRGGKRKQ